MQKKLVKAFNNQLKNEVYSGYLYLSIAAYFESLNLDGFAHWMKMQYREELEHLMKFYTFLNDRGDRVALEAIPKPPVDFSSPADAFEKALKHEKGITAAIDKLYDLAAEGDDKAAVIFLQWFVTEQVEEEKSLISVLSKLKFAKPGSAALFMFDRALAQRQ